MRPLGTKLTNQRPTGIVAALTLIVFFLTNNPFTSPFKLQLTLASLIALLGYAYFRRKEKEEFAKNQNLYFFLTLFVLFLVAATGWFFSPFFFSLYLLAIFMAFVFSPITAALFVGLLAGLFSLNIGEVDLAYDFLVVLSFLVVIPITFYLREGYLRLKEAEKEVLVLEKEKREYQDTIEAVLANTINGFAVNLRQPLNNIKQLTHRLKEVKKENEVEKNRERIIASSEEALRILRKFEEETTGKKLLTTPPKQIWPKKS